MTKIDDGWPKHDAHASLIDAANAAADQMQHLREINAELLAALKRLETAQSRRTPMGVPINATEFRKEIDAARTQARAAIARAEGGSNGS